jgi:hypothetical protein
MSIFKIRNNRTFALLIILKNKKMNKKYFKYINTLFVVIPMTLIMAFVGLMRNYGFGEDWFLKFLKAWSVMLPVAYLAAFIIIPNARKLSEKITA